MDRPVPSLVSVIIPAFDAASTIGEQLDALATQRGDVPFEVIIADDGSTDGTAEVAWGWADRLPMLKVVRTERNRGAGSARAAGALLARGGFFAFCDADDVVDEGWIAGLVAAAGRSDLVGGVLESTSINPRDSGDLRSPPPSGVLRIGMRFLPTPMGGNLGVWRDVWEALGGTDPSWGHGDDWELAFRAQLAGYRLKLAPDAMIHYRFRAGSGASARQRYRFGVTQARLYARFRRQGMPPSSLPRGLKTWASILWHLRDLVGSPRTRGRYLMRVAQRAGRVAGSVRYRVVYL